MQKIHACRIYIAYARGSGAGALGTLACVTRFTVGDECHADFATASR